MINIIGNGPSLNDINKKELFKSNNINVSYNRAYIIYDKYNFYPTYYFCIDKAVLLNCLKDITKLLTSSIQYFVLLKCDETIPLINISKKITLIEKTDENKMYFGDVSVFSINYLYNIGHNDFDVYGCDCRYVENYDKLNVDIEYNENDPARRIVLKPKKGSVDPNHFIPNYFDETTEYSIPREKNHFNCWKQLSMIDEIKIMFKTKSNAEYLFHPST